MNYYTNLTQLDCCPDGRVFLALNSKTKKKFWYYRIRVGEKHGKYITKSTKTTVFEKAEKIAGDKFREVLAREEKGLPPKTTRYAKKLDMTIPRGNIQDKRGVYTITNEKTGTVYVGMSMDILNRWRQHQRDLGRNKHSNKQLQKDWDKWGSWSFKMVPEFYTPATSRECLERQEKIKMKKIYLEGQLMYNNRVDLLIE